MARHIIHNGELVRNEKLFNADHPLFNGANNLMFSAMVVSSGLPFYQEHFKKIKEKAIIKGLILPEWMSASTFNQDIYYLLQKNRIYQGGIIKCIIYNDNPDKNADYIISAEKYYLQSFVINEEGLLIDIYRGKNLYPGSAENIESGYSSTEKSALFNSNNNNTDQHLILNHESHIARFTGANLFIIEDDIVYSPSIDEGAIDDIMREKVIEACINCKLKIYDDCIIHTSKIKSANEIFLSHPVYGIKWIVGYQERRYYRNKVLEINEELNKIFFSK